MRLTDLEPQFVRRTEKGWQDVAGLAEADGVYFLCPGCFAKNGGPVGTHIVLPWFRGRGVPDDASPGPGRWDVSGSGLADLTLSPSVDVGCWHGYVKGGEVTNA